MDDGYVCIGYCGVGDGWGCELGLTRIFTVVGNKGLVDGTPSGGRNTALDVSFVSTCT